MKISPQDLKPEQMPAFPLHNGDVWGGMTLRDYFAAKALGGIMADPDVHLSTPEQYRAIAKQSYKLADAMLEARSL